jgi:radical SAM family uncharacterized protein
MNNPIEKERLPKSIDIEIIESILRGVGKPARYCGGEYGSRIPTGKEKLNWILSYPDIYEIGFSNHGLKILYDIIQDKDDYYADMVFAPWPDMGRKLQENKIPLYGLNSKIPVNEFDIWGMNISHELLMTNVLYMLKLAQIPLLANQRDETNPIIIFGGTGITNPLPLIDFADGFFLGDGEDGVLEISQIVIEAKQKKFSKEKTLKSLSKIDGLYLPRFQKPQIDSGMNVLVPGKKIKKRNYRGKFRSDLKNVMVPNLRSVQDRVVVEVSRGCGQGCRFCHAGFWKRPVRNNDADSIVGDAENMLERTGYSEVALHSFSVADYPHLNELALKLLKVTGEKGVRLSFPSLRVSFKTIPVLELTHNVKKSNLTFALESGSEKQRIMIRKKSSEKDLLKIIKEIFQRDWNLVKLYFMIGLPGEEQETEAKEIARVLNEIGTIAKNSGRKKMVNVTVSLFVPKPHTTFQWEILHNPEFFEKSIEIIKGQLNSNRIQLKLPDSQSAYIEGILSRADHRAGRILLKAFEQGAIFDSWSEWFNWNAWLIGLSQIDKGVLNEWITPPVPKKGSECPWDFISALPSGYLKKDFNKAYSTLGSNTQKSAKPRPSDSNQEYSQNTLGTKDAYQIPNHKFSLIERIKLAYSISGNLKFIGHNDKTNLLKRVFKRSALPMRFSEGYHKTERLHFSPPLPIFAESEEEWVWIDLYENVDNTPEQVLNRINKFTPDGLNFYKVESNTKLIYPSFCRWFIDFSYLDKNFRSILYKKAFLIQSYFVEDDYTHWRKKTDLPDSGGIKPEILEKFTIKYEKIRNKLVRGRKVKKVKRKQIFILSCIRDINPGIDNLTYEVDIEGDFQLQPEKLLMLYFNISEQDILSVKIKRLRLFV